MFFEKLSRNNITKYILQTTLLGLLSLTYKRHKNHLTFHVSDLTGVSKYMNLKNSFSKNTILILSNLLWKLLYFKYKMHLTILKL